MAETGEICTMWQNSNRAYQRMLPEQDGESETEASQRKNNRTRKCL